MRLVRVIPLLAVLLVARAAAAQIVEAEPASPVVAPFPAGAAPVETQVTLQVVVDASGAVESAVEVSRLPRDAPEAFARAAIEAVQAAPFTPTSRDGHPIRSRIEYVVVFHPPAAPPSAPTPAPTPAPEENVEVRGIGWSSSRGLGDVRVDRETLTASPRQQTSEMLSAAPGFFVDHEDGEGLGNDVFLRGFDLDNGSGIEMKVGDVPINVPLHIHGQGYADANFIIPEVVESIRVLEGPYDPRQGDAAIVGSALFALGVHERGYQLKTTYGSFGQARMVGIAAPSEASDETFAAFSLRETQGFGQDRSAKSASVNGQYGVDFSGADHLRLLATAYASDAALPGVVRQDDVDAGRIGYYDAYPNNNSFFPANCSSASCAEPAQGVSAARVILSAELDHTTASGAKFAIAPWLMWTHFLSRQNYTGDLDSSNLQPDLPSLGDLWQLTNVETAAGVTASFHAAPLRAGHFLEVVAEPGVSLRFGHTDQTKDLVNPADLAPWDERESYGLNTLDATGYLDVDTRWWKDLRVSGGVRADFLDVAIDDKLAGVVPPVAVGALPGTRTNVAGVAPGPRVTAAYEALPELTPVVSAGEGFRSLDAVSLTLCNARAVAPSSQLPPCVQGSPYSQVTSVEAGVRSTVARGRFTTTLTAFQTNVANELVFAVDAGGLETERASTRRGIVGSVLARPTPWMLASTALSVQQATFDTLVAGTSHYVPNVPAVLWRVDANAHGPLLRLGDAPLTGRLGVGYTLLGGRHVTDAIVGPTSNVLNALASLRYRFVELGLDMYNVLGLAYADDLAYFVSNWSLLPGQQRASTAVHLVAAAPRTTLGTLTL
ncbi:MAG TPA: TonB-dependent receptor, partial [Polyangiaceae bacterium]|nr:TonB-dependent receptor [Polyangiaceae bacterium]